MGQHNETMRWDYEYATMERNNTICNGTTQRNNAMGYNATMRRYTMQQWDYEYATRQTTEGNNIICDGTTQYSTTMQWVNATTMRQWGGTTQHATGQHNATIQRDYVYIQRDKLSHLQ